MQLIDKKTQEILLESLLSYYDALQEGDLQKLSALMAKESYFVTLEAFCFKHAFKDAAFKKLLKEMDENENSLKKVEAVLSEDLKKESRKHQIDEISFEQKGAGRITLHYKEDTHPKKMYYSYTNGGWKIDFKAGRTL